MRPFDENKLSKVLECIKRSQEDYGVSPNFRDIQVECRIPSLASVSLYIDELKRRGLVDTEKLGKKKRKIRTPTAFEPDRGSRNTYIVGAVHCGPPTEAIEDIQGCVSLPDEIFGSDEHIILRAEGPSMINRGIFDGDLLVVRRTPMADIGQTVIALLEGNESTCKVLDRKGNKMYLRAANDTIENGKRKYDVYPMGEWHIYGIVDYVIHAPVSDEL